ncbi:MAG: hypothetical protein ISS15_04685 [Alphaproteobacteria bacterium]|nr:hypothetical protein [Alphaproteobacteria bacterium]MBL6939742.1 hypothetical protein [Alphaproteobacteria bacterium]MBL7096936.1 hypothetical protein [Alphaproteobacteria bacterium]
MLKISAVMASVAGILAGIINAPSLAFGYWRDGAIGLVFAALLLLSAILAWRRSYAWPLRCIWALAIGDLLFFTNGGMMQGGVLLLPALLYLGVGFATSLFPAHRPAASAA